MRIRTTRAPKADDLQTPAEAPERLVPDVRQDLEQANAPLSGERAAPRYVFVGERPSPRAARIGATWQNGRLSAKNLHAALVAAGLNPKDQVYLNLWETPAIGGKGALDQRDQRTEQVALRQIRRHAALGYLVVALGALVSRTLTLQGVTHRKLVHPAARGAIRQTARYQAHVRSVLLGATADLQAEGVR